MITPRTVSREIALNAAWFEIPYTFPLLGYARCFNNNERSNKRNSD